MSFSGDSSEFIAYTIIYYQYYYTCNILIIFIFTFIYLSNSHSLCAVDLLNLCEVSVDPELKILTAGGGCFLKDVDFVLKQYHFAITLGRLIGT